MSNCWYQETQSPLLHHTVFPIFYMTLRIWQQLTWLCFHVKHVSRPLCCKDFLHHEFWKAASPKRVSDLNKMIILFPAQILVLLWLELAVGPPSSFKDWTTSAWGLIFDDWLISSRHHSSELPSMPAAHTTACKAQSAKCLLPAPSNPYQMTSFNPSFT